MLTQFTKTHYKISGFKPGQTGINRLLPNIQDPYLMIQILYISLEVRSIILLISKASNKVLDTSLLSKWRKYGFSGGFKHFLIDWKLRVILNEQSSSAGDRNVKLLWEKLFTDDTELLLAFDYINFSANLLNEDLSNKRNWVFR